MKGDVPGGLKRLRMIRHCQLQNLMASSLVVKLRTKTVERTVVVWLRLFRSSTLNSTLRNNHLPSESLNMIQIQGIQKPCALSRWPCSYKHEEVIRARKRLCQSSLFKVVGFSDVIRSGKSSGEASVLREPM